MDATSPTDSTAATPEFLPTGRLGIRSLLWVLAVIIMISAVIYQKTTGPTYPRKGSFEFAGEVHKYRLIRSQWTNSKDFPQNAEVALPAVEGVSGTLFWRRYKAGDDFSSLPMEVRLEQGGESNVLAADLPKQTFAAAKYEYYIELQTPEGMLRVPEVDATAEVAADGPPVENVVIRFKDWVPGYILWPHIILMFFSVLWGMRTALAALAGHYNFRRYAWITFTGMTLGGMVLGPIVQKYAFGEFWTGWPNGYDLTDNKMLIMWVSWIVAISTIGLKPRPKEGVGRGVVVLAALAMTAVYLIPHSLSGSELDYSKIEEGMTAEEAVKAIGTGD